MRKAFKIFVALALLFSCQVAQAAGPPRIGRLVMPPLYWQTIQEAAADYRVDPLLVAAVMAIESRYDPGATNKRCRSRGLMQIQDDVARFYGLENSYDVVGNIRVGTMILARLMRKYRGNLRQVCKAYNREDDGSYSREVRRAYRQARSRSK